MQGPFLTRFLIILGLTLSMLDLQCDEFDYLCRRRELGRSARHATQPPHPSHVRLRRCQQLSRCRHVVLDPLQHPSGARCTISLSRKYRWTKLLLVRCSSTPVLHHRPPEDLGQRWKSPHPQLDHDHDWLTWSSRFRSPSSGVALRLLTTSAVLSSQGAIMRKTGKFYWLEIIGALGIITSSVIFIFWDYNTPEWVLYLAMIPSVSSTCPSSSSACDERLRSLFFLYLRASDSLAFSPRLSLLCCRACRESRSLSRQEVSPSAPST